MEQIGKTFMGLFLILIITFVGVGVVSTSVDAAHAEQYAANIANYVESSNYSEDVINKCKLAANKKGYTVEINLYDTDNDTWNDMAEINLRYKYSIQILNVKGSYHTAKAYSR